VSEFEGYLNLPKSDRAPIWIRHPVIFRDKHSGPGEARVALTNFGQSLSNEVAPQAQSHIETNPSPALTDQFVFNTVADQAVSDIENAPIPPLDHLPDLAPPDHLPDLPTLLADPLADFPGTHQIGCSRKAGTV
jgi:hypothetical protein